LQKKKKLVTMAPASCIRAGDFSGTSFGVATAFLVREGRAAAIRFLLLVLSVDKQVPEIFALTSSFSGRT
jgi:hypothetical protein